MNNLPLQPLVWSRALTAQSAFHQYLVRKDDEATKRSKSQYVVNYGRLNTQKSMDIATGFATIDEAKAWAWNHYNEKMQPYVKPMPTWISVDDRLPEMYKRVLIKADCYLVAGREPKSERNKDWGISGDWMWAIVNDSWTDSRMVTHWMPIPEFSTMQNNKGE